MKTIVRGARGSVSAPRGFSLVELMVVMAIAGILAAAATPAFTSIINNNRLASAANELTATLQNARMEATRRGKRVVVCPSDDGATCTTGVRWKGWISFEDTNGDAALSSGESILRSNVLSPPLEMISSSNVSADSRIVFRHDGFAYNKDRTQLMSGTMRACIKTASPPQNARDVTVGVGGRVAVTKTTQPSCTSTPANP